MPRLPSAQNVPSVSVARDPGLSVPMPTPENPDAGKGLMLAGQMLGEHAQQLRKAEIAARDRDDALFFATGARGYAEATTKGLRDLETTMDLADPEAGETYRTLLDEEKVRILQSYQGSEVGRERLAIRLEEIHTQQALAAGQKVATAQRQRVMDYLGDEGARLTQRVLSDPTSFTSVLDEGDTLILDLSPGLTVEDEEQLRDSLRQEITTSALNSYLMRGDLQGARGVLETPGVPEMLTPEDQRKFAQAFAEADRARTEAVREAQAKVAAAEAIIGAPLTLSQRVRLAGFTPQGGNPLAAKIAQAEAALGRPLTQVERERVVGLEPPDAQTDAGKMVQDREAFVAQYGEGSPQVQAFDEAVSTPETDLTDVAGQRKEFTALSKDYVGVRDAFNRIESSAENASPAGDLSLMFNYMKMLDPGSVVRESEFAQIAATGSFGDRLMAGAQRLLVGERLTDDQRADFLGRAQDLMMAQQRTQSRLEEQFRGIAARSKLPPEDVVVDFMGDLRDRFPSLAPGQAGATPGAGTAATGSSAVPTIEIEYDLSGNRVTTGG